MRLLHLAARFPHSLAWIIGLGLAGGALTVLQAWLFTQVITPPVTGAGQAIPWQWFWLLPGVIAGRAALAWGEELSAGRLARQIKASLRQKLFERLAQRGPAYLKGEESGELTNLAVEGVEALDPFFSQFLPQAGLAVLTPVLILAVVFPLDPLSGLVLLLTGPLIPLFMYLLGGLGQAQARKQWRLLSRMSAYFLDVLQGLTTLVLLGRSKAQVKNLEQIGERYRTATMNVLRVTFLSSLSMELIATISTAIVAVQIGLRLMYGRLDFMPAFFILLLTPEFYAPLRQLGSRFHAGMSGVAASEKIFKIVETDRPSEAQAVPGEQSAHLTGQPQIIQLKEVGYTYPDGRIALENVNLTLKPGLLTIVQGRSGAGKTTLAQLLLGFLQPTHGQVLVDGASLATLDREQWLGRVSWSPENPHLFSLTDPLNDSAMRSATIGEAIRLGRPAASLEQVQAAARLALAQDFIQALPLGYDSPLGENGVTLSRGQARRIALARAFLQEASLLILDEPTEHLDPATAQAVFANIARLAQERIVLVISHRWGETANQGSFQGETLNVIRYEVEGQVVTLEDGLIQSIVPVGRDVISPIFDRDSNAPADLTDSPSRRIPGLNAGYPAYEDTWPYGDEPGPAPLPPIESTPPSINPWRTLWRMVKLAAPGWQNVLPPALVGALTVASSVGLLFTSATLLSMAALQPSIAELQTAIVGVRFFGISRGFFRYLERLSAHDATLRLVGRLRVWFYQALEPLAPARLLQYRSGDLLTRLHNDLQALEGFYVRSLAPPLTAIFTILCLAIFLITFAPILGLAWIGVALLGGLALPLLLTRLAGSPGQAVVQARTALASAWLESLQGLGEFLVFGGLARQAGGLAAINQRLAQPQKQMSFLAGMQAAGNLALGNLGLWTLLGLALPMVAEGRLPAIYLGGLALAALAGYEAIQALPQAARQLGSDLAAGARLLEIVDAQPLVCDPQTPVENPQVGDLVVRGLTFRYPGSSLPVLNDIFFDLLAGKRLAIMGPSGSGKTTLAHLLLRFWDYEQGEITLGGLDLRAWRLADLRRQIAAIPQDAYLFSASLADNVRLARPEASEDEIRQALHLAQLDELVESLPEGLDTWIGEQGLRLSGGQRQRIAVARAILQDAPFWILDEPTARLDAETARQVMEAILQAAKGKSLLLITHRTEGLEAMDEVIELKSNGRLYGQFPHQRHT